MSENITIKKVPASPNIKECFDIFVEYPPQRMRLPRAEAEELYRKLGESLGNVYAVYGVPARRATNSTEDS